MHHLNSKSKLAFLDIETSWSRHITVIGVYRPSLGTKQLVSPEISESSLLNLLKGVEMLFTYNGSRFDLPVIETHIGIDLVEHMDHRDLMHDCWHNGLYGGLKRVEQILGIHRDTEGIDGLAAMNLWEQHRRHGDAEALEVLLRYNREDVENLEILAAKIGVLQSCSNVRGPVSASRLQPLPRPPALRVPGLGRCTGQPQNVLAIKRSLRSFRGAPSDATPRKKSRRSPILS